MAETSLLALLHNKDEAFRLFVPEKHCFLIVFSVDAMQMLPMHS